MNKRFTKIFSITICIILSLIGAYTLVLSPKYLGFAVDQMIGKNKVNILLVTVNLSIALVLYIMYFACTWLIAYTSNRLSLSVAKELRSQLEYNLNRNPLSYLDTTPLGKLLNLFTLDSEMLIDGVYQLLSQFFIGVFVVIISFMFMFNLSVFMSLMVVLMVPVMYLSSRYFAKKSVRLYSEQQELSANLSAFTSESLSNHELISNFNYQEQALEDFEKIHNEYNIVGEQTQILGALVNPTVRVINSLSYALLGIIGAFSVLNGNLSVGMFTAFISYSMIFSKPFNEFSAIIAQVSAAKVSYERIKQALSIKIDNDEGESISLEANSIEFKNVDFSYVSDKPIIKDFSLNIPALSKVAIVGPTGAGKSTLINILMRFYDIDSGEIRIDNFNTKILSKHSIRQAMSIVLQDPWLFEGSIADNIKFGKADASYKEIVEASKQAGCHDYIMLLDDGYETIINAGSTNISLGQRQMITIARAIIVDAPIIILDEATSNIDVLSEYKIQTVFRNIMKSKTSFFVAHRLATVIDSDIILVMKDGKLVEQGTHIDLMNKKGFYYSLFISQ